jgi:hypothetical protein
VIVDEWQFDDASLLDDSENDDNVNDDDDPSLFNGRRSSASFF